MPVHLPARYTGKTTSPQAADNKYCTKYERGAGILNFGEAYLFLLQSGVVTHIAADSGNEIHHSNRRQRPSGGVIQLSSGSAMKSDVSVSCHGCFSPRCKISCLGAPDAEREMGARGPVAFPFITTDYEVGFTITSTTQITTSVTPDSGCRNCLLSFKSKASTEILTRIRSCCKKCSEPERNKKLFREYIYGSRLLCLCQTKYAWIFIVHKKRCKLITHEFEIFKPRLPCFAWQTCRSK